MTNLKYDIRDVPKKWYEWILYPLQQLLAVFVATVLISQLCNTPVSSCLLGAGIGTLIYQAITKFKSPMFISSCGATVSAVCGALACNATLGMNPGDSYKTIIENNIVVGYDIFNSEGVLLKSVEPNYLMVMCGGLIILAIYAIFALIVKFSGIKSINKIFPPVIVGSITMVIGLNLAVFIPKYVNMNSDVQTISIIIAIITMLVIAVVSQYGKGFMKNIPFLFGIVAGYILALCFGLVDFSPFQHMVWYPEVTFLKWSTADWSWISLGKTVLYFLPVGICALLEHYSDHKTLSNIIGTDLTVEPGLHRTLLGDGVASAAGTILCGLPNTSYGESIATTGFSKVASVWMISVASVALIIMSFLAPVSAFIQTVPSCVFGGAAMILYGYIAASGLKTIINNKVDLEDNKNLIIASVILTVGVSGIWLFDEASKGIALAMVLGVVLNLVLKTPKKCQK